MVATSLRQRGFAVQSKMVLLLQRRPSCCPMCGNPPNLWLSGDMNVTGTARTRCGLNMERYCKQSEYHWKTAGHSRVHTSPRWHCYLGQRRFVRHMAASCNNASMGGSGSFASMSMKQRSATCCDPPQAANSNRSVIHLRNSLIGIAQGKRGTYRLLYYRHRLWMEKHVKCVALYY